MAAFDLYAELGVAADASPQDVHKAYRRAMKHVHPDKGGKRADYDRAELAHGVLSDPGRRAHYDATGEVVDKPADNVLAGLLTVLTQLFGKAMDAAMQGGNQPATVDLVALMIAAAEDGVAGTQKQFDGLEKNMAMLATLEGRFEVVDAETPNHMAAIIAGQRAQIELMRKNMEQGKKDLLAGKLYLQGCRFKKREDPLGGLQGIISLTINV